METSHIIFWLALVVIVGHVMTKQRQRTRQTGVLIGVLVFLWTWWQGSYADPNAPALSVWFARGLLALAVTAASWIVLTVLQFVLGGPANLLKQTFGTTLGSVVPRWNSSYSAVKDSRCQKQLAKSRERIALLENIPNKMPENFDELATHVIAWSQRRESIMRKGEDVRQQLDNLDAVFAKELVVILEKQEGEYGGRQNE